MTDYPTVLVEDREKALYSPDDPDWGTYAMIPKPEGIRWVEKPCSACKGTGCFECGQGIEHEAPHCCPCRGIKAYPVPMAVCGGCEGAGGCKPGKGCEDGWVRIRDEGDQ